MENWSLSPKVNVLELEKLERWTVTAIAEIPLMFALRIFARDTPPLADATVKRDNLKSIAKSSME
jgi:hypothetical protein